MTDLAAAAPWPDAAGRRAASLPIAGADAPPSRAVFWAGVFIVLVFSGGWVTFVLGPDREATGAAGPLIIALHFPAYIAAVWLLATGGRASVRALLVAPPVLLLAALALASTHWSTAPDLTMRRAPALLMTSLGGVSLAARFGWRRLSEVLACAFAVLVVGCYLMGTLLPSWGRMTTLFPGAWRGLWVEKNGLGDHMTAGVGVLLAAAVLNPPRRALWASFAAAALGLILLSTSKTSLVTLGAALAAMAGVAGVRRGGVAAVLTVFAAAVALTGAVAVVLLAPDKLFLLLGKDATLTGRTVVWSGALRIIQARPWLGFGYGAVWDDKGVWAPVNWIIKEAKWRPHHAHNTWIELRLALGWLGMGTFVALMAQAWLRLLAGLARGGEAAQGAWLAAPFLASWLLQSFTESVGLNYNDFTWVMTTALAVALGRPRREAATAGAASMAAP